MRVLLVALLTVTIVFTNASPADLWRAVLDPEVLYEVSDNIPALATKLNLTTLVQFVTKAGLAGPLSGPGPFTVFGPDNAAFGKLPKALVDILMKNTTLLAEVLKYHVIAGAVYSSAITNELTAPTLLPGADIRLNVYGKTVTASGRKVIKVDQNATNGVIHVLGGVMLPPAGTVTKLAQETPKTFSTLVHALVAANLANALNGPGPFTVFAPTNQAFANLPPGALIDLLKNPKKLAAVLLYHVVDGTFYSAALSDGLKVQTKNGKNVTVSISGSNVKVNDANVIEADVTVTNGAVHVIDAVLLPPNMRFERIDEHRTHIVPVQKHEQYRMRLIKTLNSFQVV
ncbi:hypothetical protein LOTGIDRAFT_200505 [Lottia gigantea]|uniref:FAS1 domain-containing protein n=1 Tax=Lottia gigantea TaxID=225164 RepID=V4CG37_LOTGI|nr:hypothetical protein LOTGIDRAFT_200505 [Lottia gigantea]ESP01025.1 hypothetical protein LOTGIDRAFT_200505 [Lottia gigantea]